MISKNLITLIDPKSPAAEAYRMLRTNIEFTNIDNENKSILITSSKSKEGKSTSIVNIAITIANRGKKVIILDCDLRKPRMHKLFNLSNEIGITNVVVNNKEIEHAIHSIEEVESLSVLTSGPRPPMPSELLASKKMLMLLETLKSQYDYILIDTPPVLSVTDASVLSNYVDGVILTVAIGETKIEVLKTAKKTLDKVNANIIGTILTKAQHNKKGFYYYDYHYDNEKTKIHTLKKIIKSINKISSD